MLAVAVVAQYGKCGTRVVSTPATTTTKVHIIASSREVASFLFWCRSNRSEISLVSNRIASRSSNNTENDKFYENSLVQKC